MGKSVTTYRKTPFLKKKLETAVGGVGGGDLRIKNGTVTHVWY